ncbi:MAG: antibiotic biosynthesis monooxygenase [Desulfobacterota bacterium]|nr:antibiotic biosynthesis monooxygenase [Thermodesulfobacteriota bacterium]
MVYVIATIRVKPQRRFEFLEIFKANVPRVRAEKGCIEYVPTLDLPAGLPLQSLDEDRVTVIEKWESLEALQNHLTAPHMLAYKEKVKDIVEGVSLKVLQEA